MGYVIVAIFLMLSVFILVMFHIKINTHFELLSSIDISLKRYSDAYHLARSKRFKERMLAMVVFFPIFYLPVKGKLNPDQVKLKQKLKRQLATLYIGMAVWCSLFFL